MPHPHLCIVPCCRSRSCSVGCASCRYELWRLGDLRLITRARVRGALPADLATGTPQQGVQCFPPLTWHLTSALEGHHVPWMEPEAIPTCPTCCDCCGPTALYSPHLSKRGKDAVACACAHSLVWETSSMLGWLWLMAMTAVGWLCDAGPGQAGVPRRPRGAARGVHRGRARALVGARAAAPRRGHPGACALAKPLGCRALLAQP